jgi:hypothetical protein
MIGKLPLTDRLMRSLRIGLRAVQPDGARMIENTFDYLHH